jgi:hypothetical protein
LGQVGIAPFPVPAHQTGRADLPHPAFRLWAEQYDRPLGDIFAVQDEVTAAIAARLGATIERAEADLARRKAPADLGAYDYYLQGRVKRVASDQGCSVL